MTDDPNITEAHSRPDLRFIAAYNRIDSFMRDTLHTDESESFSRLRMRLYNQYPWLPGESDLRVFSSLRNVIAHTQEAVDVQLFIPSMEAIDRIEAVATELLSPETAIPRYTCDVMRLEAADSLTAVLRAIKMNDWSQFPVYNCDQFCGLLTEKSIARWLASNVNADSATILPDDVTVRELLSFEEHVERFRFMRADATVDEVAHQFSLRTDLEAVLFTANADTSEELQGIATTWDLFDRKRAARSVA